MPRTGPRRGSGDGLGSSFGVGQPRRDHVYAIVNDDHDCHRDVEGAERGVELVADLLTDGALVRVDFRPVEEQWRDADEGREQPGGGNHHHHPHWGSLHCVLERSCYHEVPADTVAAAAAALVVVGLVVVVV